MLGLSHPIPSSASMLHTFSRDFNMTANQLFLDINSQFQNQNFVHGDTAIDPGLGSLSAGITDNMASTLAGHQMMSAAFWHAGMDHQMRLNNQLPRTSQVDNGFDGFGESVSQDEPSEDVTTPSNTSRTRSTSENSNRPSRTRFMHSSRSSILSTKSGSSEHVQKPRKGKQQSKRQRKQSNTSATSRTSSQQQDMQGSWDETNEHDEKRNCFLERNRVAASKCRQKKKEWVSDLEENKNNLENLNKNLHMKHNSLIAELTGMKNVLMTHANCHDPYIDQWIDNEARRFIQNTAERYANVPVLTLLRCAGSHHDSRRESFAIQPSPPMSIKSQPTSPKGDEINYGHMPDDMFEDQAIDTQA